MKKLTRYLMQSTNIPIRLWNYGFEFTTMDKSVTTSSKVEINHKTTFEFMVCYTPDVLNLTSVA